MVVHNLTSTLTERQAFGHWLSGFTDAEGCFTLRRTSERCITRFSIEMRSDDEPILKSIKAFLGDRGAITSRQVRRQWNPQLAYAIGGIKDIYDVLVPQFDEFPLRAKKANDYMIWRRGAILQWHVGLREFERFGKGGVRPKWFPHEKRDFAEFAAQLCRQRKYTTCDKPAVEVSDPEAFGHYIAGLVDGEGTFITRRAQNTAHCEFAIHIRSDDRPILDAIASFLGVGKFYSHATDKSVHCLYRVSSREDTSQVIVPFFERFPLRAKKRHDFDIWKQAANLCCMIKQRSTKACWSRQEYQLFDTLDERLRSGRKFAT